MAAHRSENEQFPSGPRVRNDARIGSVRGSMVQAGIVHGDVRITQAPDPLRYTLQPYRRRVAVPAAERARRWPSRLLAADSQVVDFIGRADELDRLTAWRDARVGPEPQVLLLHGTGGQGKTRLTAEFAERSLGDGWSVLEARHDDSAPVQVSANPEAPEGGKGVVVIVDYAERWPSVDLLRLMRDPGLESWPGIRILLVSRPSGSWWNSLAYRLDRLGLTVDPHLDQIMLAPLARSAAERRAIFLAACSAFVNALRVPAPHDFAMPAWLDENSRGHVLTIHMAALAAVDAHARGRTAPGDPAGVSSYLLNRERAHWQAMYTVGHSMITTSDAMMARVVFTAALTGSQRYAKAVEVLADAELATTREGAGRLLDDHAVCYPPVRADQVLEPLYPDRLSEDFVALQTPGGDSGHPSDAWADDAWERLLAPRDGGNPPHYERHALIVLIEAAHRWPHLARNHLFPLLRRHPGLALIMGGATLARLADLPDIDTEMLFEIEKILPLWHLDLDVGMAALVQRLVDEAADSISDPIARSLLYRRLSGHLAEISRLEDALSAIEQAVEILRPLAWDDPQRFIPKLAFMLSDYAGRLSHMGRLDEAVAVIADAVWYRRQLLSGGTSEAGEHRATELGASLGTLSGLLRDQGRAEEALAAIDEAITLLRPAATRDPDGFEPDLARAMAVKGTILASLGRWERAFTATATAVLVWRLRAAAEPEHYTSDLAWALGQLSRCLVDVARTDEALEAAEEAVSLYRLAAEAQPAGYRFALVGALAWYGDMLWNLNRWDEATAVAVEVVEIRRELLMPNATGRDCDLGLALSRLSARLLNRFRAAEASAAAVEAVELLERAADRDPDVYGYDLALGLSQLSEVHIALGDPKRAIREATRSVELLRRHGSADPLTLAGTLEVLSSHLIWSDRADDAVAAAREALDLFNRRTDVMVPVQIAMDRLGAFNTLAVALVRASRFEDAVEAARSAVAMFGPVRRAAFDWETDKAVAAQDTLSAALAGAGRREEALAVAEECLREARGLCARSADYEPSLLRALANLALRQADGGRWADARACTAEGVAACRRFAERTRDEQAVWLLARSLWRFAFVRVVGEAETAEAVEAAAESVRLYDRLRPVAAETFARERRSATIIWARALDAVGRPGEAAHIRDAARTAPQEHSDTPVEW